MNDISSLSPRRLLYMRYLSLIAVLLYIHPIQAPAQTVSPVEEKLTAAEITKLIDECGSRTTEMAARVYNYSFVQTEVYKAFDKKGSVKDEYTKVFEVYPITINGRARIIYVQLSENNMPFSAEKIAAQRERAARETMDLEKQSRTSALVSPYRVRFWSYGIKAEKHARMSRTYWYIRPTDFLLGYDFFSPQRVTIGGRETVMLSFRPRPGYIYDETNVPYPQGIADYAGAMSQLGGRIWIDAIDKVLLRVEARAASEPPDANSNDPAKPATAFLFEFQRQPNGTWLPSRNTYNSFGREHIFWKTSMSRSVTYSDYKLFKTTADVDKTEPAPQKP